ncbi:argininosuccinate synthase [bacterium]|nr:MAG: argininosuccinate synthase [bacterium]
MKIVLAYSGGLDTSVLLKKYIEAGHEVVALTADLGESDAAAGSGAAAQQEQVRAKALALGALDAVMIDAKERFFDEYCLPALGANALYQGIYPLSAALSRPLISSMLVETAHRYGAQAVAHGCTGKGNDQVRFEVTAKALDPSLRVLAPLREQPMSRPDALAYAKEHGVPVLQKADKPYSIDANFWGRSIESGVLEDPWNAPPEDCYGWTAAPEQRPAQADEVVISFRDGAPSIDGATGAEMVLSLNKVAGKHGVGRIDMVEDRVVGLKSREVYECPGSVTLIAAHQALERLVLTRDELRFKAQADRTYTNLIYDGLWLQPLRTALDAFNAVLAPRLTGEVRMRLHQGQAVVVGSRSPFAVYDKQLATYAEGDTFHHDAAGGFIELWGLPVVAAAKAAPRAAGTAQR